MGKVEDLRAIKDARFAAAQKGAPAAGEKSAAPVSARPVTRRAPAKPAAADTVAAPATDGLCGHRAISGKTCNREKGHSEKAHRYPKG